jgi:hypothetical protein
MRFRSVVALGLAALAATVLASPAVAGASTSSHQAPPVGVAVAAGTATPTTTVDLYAWPTDAVLAAMTPGQLVPRKLLATATTNAAGKYTLTVPAATLEAATVDSGYANLEIDSPGSGIWSFPYQVGMLPAQTPATETVNLGGKKKPWPCGYMSNGQPYYVSGWTLLAQKNPAWAVVGQGYIGQQKKIRGDWVTFDYNLGSNRSQASSLGIGISGYGLSAGYSTNGAKTSTGSFTEGYHNSRKNAWFRTEFNTAQYRAECYGIPSTPVPVKKQHGACPKKHDESYVHMCLWRVSSTTWFGGSNQQHPSYTPPAPAKFCAPHQPGDHFNNDLGSAVEWSNGFTIGAAIDIKGVNLKADFGSTAHTGYDTNAQMYFHFARNTWLCGTNGSEAKAAILEARARRD